MTDLVLDEMLGLRNPRDIAEIERLAQSASDNWDKWQAQTTKCRGLETKVRSMKAVVDVVDDLHKDWEFGGIITVTHLMSVFKAYKESLAALKSQPNTDQKY